MAHKYLVWKDPACNGRNIEWVEMSGPEFYRFVSLPENKDRRFIRLDDSACGEADVIVIEATVEQYRKWLPERDSHKYLMETQAGKQTLSLDQLLASGGGITLEDLNPDAQSLEDTIIDQLLLNQLSELLRFLGDADREVLNVLFLHNRENLSEREIARQMGIPRMTLNSRKASILKKLKNFLVQN